MSRNGPAGWAFWLWWVLASGLGWSLGLPVALVVLRASGNAGARGRLLAPVVMLAVVSGVAAIVQWLLLRRHVLRCRWWVLASTLGGALAGGVSEVCIPPVGFAVVGAVTGMAQWLAVRRSIPRAGWRVVASTIGWAAGFPFVFAVSPPVRRAVDLSTILPVSDMVADIVEMSALSGVMGAVPAVLSGAVLAWLIRQPDLEARLHVS
jgi:hypothetical protein